MGFAKRGQAITFDCAKRGPFVASTGQTAPSSASFLSERQPGSPGRTGHFTSILVLPVN